MSPWLHFRTHLLAWYRPERRPMPWKAEPAAYRVWLSEIILQQTRVEQGRAYYERFVETYPGVADLAAAADDDVMKLWEGLGYYSRARNLLKTARMVEREHGGRFPDTYAELLKLPGVGPYTAAAIASFAFDRQVAVLDGNVYRVLSRYAGDATPIDTGSGRKHFQAMVDRALGDARARLFNQAIMDFGALVCTPKRADCPNCPLREECVALARGEVYDLPKKEKKLKRRDRYFHFLVLDDGSGRRVIGQRTAADIWQDLYQFPLIEASSPDVGTGDLPSLPDWPAWLPAAELQFQRRSEAYVQQLTHQRIHAIFHRFEWTLMPGTLPEQRIVQNKMLENFAFPKVINRFLADKRLLLDLF